MVNLRVPMVEAETNGDNSGSSALRLGVCISGAVGLFDVLFFGSRFDVHAVCVFEL